MELKIYRKYNQVCSLSDEKSDKIFMVLTAFPGKMEEPIWRGIYTDEERGESRNCDMRIPNNLGMILLAIWLILEGLIQLLGLSFDGLGVIMGLLALAAGILILLPNLGR